VALVVSASINWGKRCPHFLAERSPPFFATSLRANGKNGHARRRGKKTLFFRCRTSRRQVTEEETSPSLRFRRTHRESGSGVTRPSPVVHGARAARREAARAQF